MQQPLWFLRVQPQAGCRQRGPPSNPDESPRPAALGGTRSSGLVSSISTVLILLPFPSSSFALLLPLRVSSAPPPSLRRLSFCTQSNVNKCLLGVHGPPGLLLCPTVSPHASTILLSLIDADMNADQAHPGASAAGDAEVLQPPPPPPPPFLSQAADTVRTTTTAALLA